jgi:hypothetical protein
LARIAASGSTADSGGLGAAFSFGQIRWLHLFDRPLRRDPFLEGEVGASRCRDEHGGEEDRDEDGAGDANPHGTLSRWSVTYALSVVAARKSVRVRRIEG